MSNAKITLIHNQDDLFKVIENNTANIKAINTINLYCVNFEAYISNFEKKFKNHLLNLAAQNKKVKVYSYDSVDMKNIVTRQIRYYLDKRGAITDKETSFCVYNMQSAETSILYKFVKSLLDKLPDGKKINNLSNAVDKFLKQEKSCQILVECINKNLKAPLIERIQEFEEFKLFGNEEELKTSLNDIFDELNQSIQKIYNEGYNQAYKEIVNFFFSIIEFANIKKIFKKSNLLFFANDLLFEGGRTLSNILKWTDSKYSYAISNSIIRLFIQDLAPIITLFENRILNNTLVIDKKIDNNNNEITMIEFSGFNTKANEAITSLKQDLGICVKFITQTKQDFNNNINLNICSNNINIYNKNNICESLQSQMSSSNGRLIYIESPFFNSIELTRLIKEQENKSKEQSDEAKQGFNYLIISNAPYKHNAGLNAKLIDKLGNKISHNNKAQNKVSSDMFYPKLDKHYSEVVDYSKYQITINATKKESYVLSLSPFVNIDKKQYQQHKDLYNKYLKLKMQDSMPSYSGIGSMGFLMFKMDENNMQKVKSYEYIQSFFKQPKDKEEILEKEEQYFKESITCLQGYIDSIILIGEAKHGIQGISYIFEVKKHSYSALEVLLLALTYYVIKNFYGKVDTDTQTLLNINTWGYECINIGGEIIKIFTKDSHLTTSNNDIPLYFSIKQKSNNHQSFCIEEFVNAVEKSDQNQTLSEQEQKTLDMLFTYIDNDNTTKEYDDIEKHINRALQEIDVELSKIEQQQRQKTKINNQKILEDILKDFITAYFPFTDILFNLSGIDIIHKFTKTLLKISFSKKFSDFLIEEVGLLYIAIILNSDNKTLYTSQAKYKEHRANARMKKIKKKAFVQLARIHKTRTFEVIALGDIVDNQGMKSLKNALREKLGKEKQYANIKDKHKREVAINKEIKRKIIKQKGLFARDFITDAFKNFAKSMPQTLVLNIFNQSFITEYEKSKAEFEKLNFLKLGYKYNYPYALEREDTGVYYPMIINNTFFSFNVYSMIIGGELRTGGLGIINALFYHLSNSTQAKDYLLQKLLGYILLDELRGINKAQNLNYYINDIEFFVDGINKASLDILKNNKELYKLRDEEKLKSFRDLDDNKIKAIDCYNRCIDILSDIANGNINTDKKTNQYQAKYREFLENLDIIGNNNIRAMYVGINDKNLDSNNKDSQPTSDNQTNEQKDKKAKRPKTIGRLATTIIIEDGLCIG